MLLIFALSLLFALALLGWGALAAAVLDRASGVDLQSRMALGEHGLLGLALLAPVGLLSHWVVALDGNFGLAVVVAGLTGTIACRRRLQAALAFGLPPALTPILLLALLVAISGEAVQQRMPSDSGLYHLQTILMAEDSPVVLGAANIHVRFGYNSAWLILCAMFALPGHALGGAIVLNGVAGLFGLTGMVQRAGAAIRQNGPTPSAVFAMGAILLISFAKMLPHNIGGPSTDFPSGLLTVYTFLLALVVVETPPPRRLEAQALGALLLTFPVAALAILCKTAQMPVALAVLLLAGALIPWRQPEGLRVVLVGTAVAALLAVAWVLHGLASSGCILYPVSATCLVGLPWTVPAAVADADRASIISFARIPDPKHGLVPDDWRWISVWLAEIRGERLVVSLKVAVGLVSALLLLRLATGGRLRCLGETLDPVGRRAALGLVAVAVTGLCYWFLAAPALRFGYGFLVTLPILLLSLVAPAAPVTRSALRASRWVAPALVAVSVLLAIDTATRQTADSLLATDRPPIPVVDLIERWTPGGTRYFVPENDDSCWASPRFCTPRPNPGLEFGRLGPWRTATSAP